MIRQDYLLRMIEQAAQMLARLVGLQQTRQVTAAAELSRQAAGQWLELEGAQLLSLDDEELIEHLRRTKSISEFPLRLGVAINLLRAEGERLSGEGDPAGARELQARALCLLLRAHILGVAPDLPEFTPRPTVFLNELRDDELPERAAVLLMCYHEHVGDFARAEDVLHSLKQRAPGADWLRELGGQFYQRLLRRTDVELMEGNLPRPEVEQGLREWTERKA